MKAVATYGGGLSYAGDQKVRRDAADRLIRLGYLRGGDYRNVGGFTTRGTILFKRIMERHRAHIQKQLDKERQEFEG